GGSVASRQPPNVKASASTGGSVKSCRIMKRKLVRLTSMASVERSAKKIVSVSFRDLDLLPPLRLDQRLIAFFHNTAPPQQPVSHRPHIQTRSGEDALIPFQDRHRQRFRPPAAEIDVDQAPTLTDRRDLALRHREMASFREQICATLS